MASLTEELESWDDLSEEEREQVRRLLEDLGLHLDVHEDPDEFE